MFADEELHRHAAQALANERVQTNAPGQVVLKLKKPLESMRGLAATRHGKTGG